MENDSVTKIVTRYFATLTKVPFCYEEKPYQPKSLKVSPLLLRDYTCPPSCGGCCLKFSLDYIAGEHMPEGVTQRTVQFNGRAVKVWTDIQSDNPARTCRHLQPKDGRCGIYTVRPFSCDFELIRTLQNEDPDRANVLTQKLFGRGWSFQRVDGGQGALCEMTPITEKSIKEVIRKLGRLQQWAAHFGLETWAPELIAIVERGHLDHQIILRQHTQAGMGL